MSQVFTEIPLPKRDKELVVSVQWIDKSEYSECATCTAYSDWQCYICAQWTCDLHEHKQQFRGWSICENCGKLSRFEQEQVLKFREEMNAL